MTDEDILRMLPATPPSARLLWTAIIDVGDRQDLGTTSNGHRRIVPILSGQFYAGPGIEGLEGTVVPGGADRQLLRPDGVKELDALYEMRLVSGEILTIHNRVIVDEAREPERYAMSVISVTAPIGRFDWLNRRLIVGTLQTMRPERQAVVVRAWEVDTLDVGKC